MTLNVNGLRSNVPVIGGQLVKATRLVIQCPDSLRTREELRVDSPGQCLKSLHEGRRGSVQQFVADAKTRPDLLAGR